MSIHLSYNTNVLRQVLTLHGPPLTLLCTSELGDTLRSGLPRYGNRMQQLNSRLICCLFEEGVGATAAP